MACCRPCALATMGGVDGGECDKAVAIVWPSEVDDLKRRLLVIAENMDLGVAACPSLAPMERSAWRSFFDEFRFFANKETDLFGSYNVWTQACGYAHTIDGWQEKLAASCDLPGPKHVEGASTAGVELVKWVAVAAVAIALVYGVSKVVR